MLFRTFKWFKCRDKRNCRKVKFFRQKRMLSRCKPQKMRNSDTHHTSCHTLSHSCCILILKTSAILFLSITGHAQYYFIMLTSTVLCNTDRAERQRSEFNYVVWYSMQAYYLQIGRALYRTLRGQAHIKSF